MKNKLYEYPHPVLNEYNNDFVESDFSIKITDHNDSGDTIRLYIEYELHSGGLEKLVDSGSAKTIVRLTCFRTSFRESFDFNQDRTVIIEISKKNIVDFIDVQGLIVATQNTTSYSLEEFNKEYFGSSSFILRKGDILAIEPGLKIRLNSILEKDAAGIVQVRGNANESAMKVHYASIEDEDPSFTEYIYIDLPDSEYKTYARLRTKKHLKNGIERFLQAALILPAITEGISKIREQEEMIEDDIDTHYIGTIWADSIIAAVQREFKVDSISDCGKSDYEIANQILGNIVGDAVSNLNQKMEEWSTIRQEDEVL